MGTQLPTSKQKVLEGDLFDRVWFRYLDELNRATRGDTAIKLGGVLNIDTDSAGSVGSGATDLISYELPANSLQNEGDLLEIEAWGTFAANTNNKNINLEFGSQTLLTTGSLAANNGSWKIKASIVRKEVDEQEVIADIISSNSSVVESATRTAGTQDLNSNQTVKIEATGVSDDDIIQYGLIIKLNPNS